MPSVSGWNALEESLSNVAVLKKELLEEKIWWLKLCTANLLIRLGKTGKQSMIEASPTRIYTKCRSKINSRDFINAIVNVGRVRYKFDDTPRSSYNNISNSDMGLRSSATNIYLYIRATNLDALVWCRDLFRPR
jgi:hypothetical protein